MKLSVFYFITPLFFAAQLSLSLSAQEKPLEVVSGTHSELANSQQSIDKLNNATQKMLQEYREILQQKDYQQYYNFQLKQLDSSQQQEIKQLQTQLQELDYIEVAIMPLMQSMLVALEEFVALDIPFRQQYRMDGVQKLRSRLNSGSLSLPDKYRLLMEAWQIEHDYGRSIETWRGLLSDSTGMNSDENLSADALSGNSLSKQALSVNYLRVGRTAFYYQSLDGSQMAIWDNKLKSWQPLPIAFAHDLQRSMQIAADRIAPELMPLPLPTIWGEQQ